MPNCGFYATKEDHAQLLPWVFAQKECCVYESYSAVDKPLQQFTSAEQVLAEFQQSYSNGKPVTQVELALYVLGAGPPLIPKRIALDPRYVSGGAHRYAAEGWGLIRLSLSVPSPTELRNSNTNHQSQKRAEAWESVANEMLGAATWDFKKIAAFSSRLNRAIRKQAVGKLGSYAVLPGAAELWRANFPFLPNIWQGAELVPTDA